MYSVLQVTPELNAGGVERTTVEMAEAISRAGGLALVASAGGRLEPDLEAAGGELLKLPVDSKNPITVWLNAGRLERAAKARGIRLVHARSRAPGWSALLAARRLQLPFVTTYHGIYNARSPLKRFYNSVMSKGDVVIANSEFTRQHVLREYDLDPKRVVAIPRGVDLDQFDPDKIDASAIAKVRASWGLSADDARLVIIMPARLTRWKGQLVLIDAIARLHKRKPNSVRVIFAGDAQGRQAFVDEMEQAIAQGGLRDVVSIVGHVGQISTALAASDIAVFPSIEPEAFGRGAVEASAMCKPVVAAAHGGLTETIIDGETGFLVKPADPDALASAIEKLIDLGAAGRAQMGKKGQIRVRQYYSKTALQSATLRVYDQLLGEAR